MLASVSGKTILFFRKKKKKKFLKYISNNIYKLYPIFFKKKIEKKTLFENRPFILEQRKGKKVRTCFK
jgi:hypothetical protein